MVYSIVTCAILYNVLQECIKTPLQEDANDSEDEGAVFLDLTGLKQNKEPQVLDNAAVLVEPPINLPA